MLDILLAPDGDLNITGSGDIQLTGSVRQAIRVRLLWFFAEWRFAPGLGVPWFEDALVKNPNTARMRARVRREVLSVRGVIDARGLQVEMDARRRAARISFAAVTSEGTYMEEVEVPWPNTD